MNPADFTNAVKAGVIAVINTGMALGLATAVMLGWSPDLEQFSVMSVSLEAFVNALLGLWVVLTYKNSPTRASTRTLRNRSAQPDNRGLDS